VRKRAQYRAFIIFPAQCSHLFLFPTLPHLCAPLAERDTCVPILEGHPVHFSYSAKACKVISDASHHIGTFPLIHQVLGDLGIAFPQSVLRDSTVIMCIIMFKVCHALATVVAHYYMSFCVKQATLQRRYMDSSSIVVLLSQLSRTPFVSSEMAILSFKRRYHHLIQHILLETLFLLKNSPHCPPQQLSLWT
jgi:hypothetical protein